MLERHTGNDPITLTWKERILPIKLMPHVYTYKLIVNNLVHLEGLEPTRLTAAVSKTATATNYVTDANLKLWSKRLDSNQRPYASKANALPTAEPFPKSVEINPAS